MCKQVSVNGINFGLMAIFGSKARGPDSRAQSGFKAKNFVGKLIVVPDSKWPPTTTKYSEREDYD